MTIVGDIMLPVEECVVVTLTEPIGNLKAELRKAQHRTAIVIDENRVAIGVITVSDLLFANDDEEVSAHYQGPAYCVVPSTVLGKAKLELYVKKVHQLIVIDHEASKIPVGLIWDYQVVLGPNLGSSTGKKKDVI